MRYRLVRTFLFVTTAAAGAGGCATAHSAVSPSPFPTLPHSAPPREPDAEVDSVPPTVGSDLEAAVVRNALDLQGVPYRLGGDSPASGFDCSGFVHYLFARHNIDMPRTVAEQFSVGFPATLNDVREGDLIFFTTTAPGPSHVGLAVGNGAFIHAPSHSGTVRIERLDSQYWHDRVVAVKRLF